MNYSLLFCPCWREAAQSFHGSVPPQSMCLCKILSGLVLICWSYCGIIELCLSQYIQKDVAYKHVGGGKRCWTQWIGNFSWALIGIEIFDPGPRFSKHLKMIYISEFTIWCEIWTVLDKISIMLIFIKMLS